ncbi:MAG: 1-acyl-sn-glycerol-3-phosphate acyltransferase [Pontixanthobacter sp.]
MTRMTETIAVRPGRKPTLLSRFVRWIIFRIWRLQGWRITSGMPNDLKKFVIAGAPHASNWDFVFFIGATAEEGVQPSFMGKHTLFKGVMRNFMLDMGGVSIDRRRSANKVEQVAEAFARRDALALVIAAEGTRTSDGTWRSGFYHIAQAADVPIVPCWVSPQDRRIGFGPPIWPSGDYGADLTKIAAFLRANRPEFERYKVLEAQAAAIIAQGRDTVG